jgi:hypothetical protein
MMAKPESQESNEALEHRRVLYLLGEAVEKLVRLRQVLARQRVFVEAGNEKPEYPSVIDPLSKALEKQSQRLAINSARIASFLRRQPLSEEERVALRGILQSVINVVLGFHEALILLPRETVEPQVFRVLRDCFKEEWKPTPVIMTNALTSYEYRIEDVLVNLDIGQGELEEWTRLLRGFTRGGSILAQAFLDRDNPLAWAVLSHEYGHALDPDKGVSKKIVYGDGEVEKEIADGDPKVKWVSEIFADFVAARVFGPASQVPILLLEMSRPSLMKIRDEAPSHPPTTVRLGLVREYLKELNVGTGGFEEVFEMYNFDYARKVSALEEPERSKRKELGEAVGKFLQSHIAAVAAKVGSLKLCPFGNQQLDHARELQKQLQSDLPVSSLRQTPIDRMLAELNSLVESKADRERVYEVLSGFNEVPATSAEILTAGWLYKLGSFEERLKQTFPEAGSKREADVDEYGKYLARTDELLLRSIELTAVHAEIMRG